jgi:hypothetical protein
MCHQKTPPNETITDEARGNLDLWVHVRWQNLGATGDDPWPLFKKLKRRKSRTRSCSSSISLTSCAELPPSSGEAASEDVKFSDDDRY